MSFYSASADSVRFIRLFILDRIACRYASFEQPVAYMELAQAQLIGYFDTLEEE